MHATRDAAGARSRRGWAVLACAALLWNAGVEPADSAELGGKQAPSQQRARDGRSHAQFGIASVYARMLHGRTTASGEKHDGNDLTAAHRTLPLGTLVRVTNLANHRSVVVRVNDRGPQLKSRIIDLSPSAAAEIGLRARGKGIARVRLDVVTPAVADADTAAAGMASMEEKHADRASKERVRQGIDEAKEGRP